jgi:hypothetical protein
VTKGKRSSIDDSTATTERDELEVALCCSLEEQKSSSEFSNQEIKSAVKRSLLPQFIGINLLAAGH